MKSYEFSARTVEKAIKEGLEKLGKNQEDVDIKILNEGGLFKKAKIVINIDDEDGLTSFVNKEQTNEINEINSEKTLKEEKSHLENDNSKKDSVKTDLEPKEEVIQKVGEKPQCVITPVNVEEKDRKFEEIHFENNTTSVNFITGLLDKMGIEAKVSLTEKKDCSEINIDTKDSGKVIGYRGETLQGIQVLANTIELDKNRNAKRVVVDSGNYKKQREEKLRALAIRIAGKVEDTGRPYKLEPMNAFERRIIHTELQNYTGVETHSEGVEPYRHIVVIKTK